MTLGSVVPPGAQPVRRRSGVRVVFGTLGVISGVLVLLFEIAISGLFVVAVGVGLTQSLVAASTGAGAVVPEVAVEEEPECDSSVPEVPYEVFGSNELVTRIAAHLVNGSDRVDVTDLVGTSAMPSLDRDDIRPAFREAIYQNPYVLSEVTWLPGQFHGCDVLFLSYSRDAAERSGDQERLQLTARDTLAWLGIDATWADVDKAIVINNWILDNTSYDYDVFELAKAEGEISAEQRKSTDARGTMFGTGKAICGGYSDAFLLLAREAGLEAVTVSGHLVNPSDGSDGRHAWSRVKLDGAWTSLDVTWNDDDREGELRNDYLFLSEPDGYIGQAERVPDGDWMLEEFHYLYETGW